MHRLGQVDALDAYGLTKEAASLKEWLAMLLAGTFATGSGVGVGKLNANARGLKNIPAYVGSKIKGTPFNPPHCDDCARPSPARPVQNIADQTVPKNLV